MDIVNSELVEKTTFNPVCEGSNEADEISVRCQRRQEVDFLLHEFTIFFSEIFYFQNVESNN